MSTERVAASPAVEESGSERPAFREGPFVAAVELAIAIPGRI
jgi:hypothetical protein